jgi:hypothetical protein
MPECGWRAEGQEPGTGAHTSKEKGGKEKGTTQKSRGVSKVSNLKCYKTIKEDTVCVCGSEWGVVVVETDLNT